MYIAEPITVTVEMQLIGLGLGHMLPPQTSSQTSGQLPSPHMGFPAATVPLYLLPVFQDYCISVAQCCEVPLPGCLGGEQAIPPNSLRNWYSPLASEAGSILVYEVGTVIWQFHSF